MILLAKGDVLFGGKDKITSNEFINSNKGDQINLFLCHCKIYLKMYFVTDFDIFNDM